MCRADVGTLSGHERSAGRVLHRRTSPVMGQIVIDSPGMGLDPRGDALHPTLVDKHGNPSEISRLKRFVPATNYRPTNPIDYLLSQFMIGISYS